MNVELLRVVLPDKHVLESMEQELPIDLGISMVHPDDQFVKKIGRDIAIARLEPKTALLHEIQQRGTRTVYHMSVIVENHKEIQPKHLLIELGISFVPESDHTRLEYAFFGHI